MMFGFLIRFNMTVLKALVGNVQGHSSTASHSSSGSTIDCLIFVLSLGSKAGFLGNAITVPFVFAMVFWGRHCESELGGVDVVVWEQASL